MHDDHPLYPAIKNSLTSIRYVCEKKMSSSITYSYARNFVTLFRSPANIVSVALTDEQVRQIDAQTKQKLRIQYYRNDKKYRSRGWTMTIANEDHLELAKPYFRQAYENLHQSYRGISWYK